MMGTEVSAIVGQGTTGDFVKQNMDMSSNKEFGRVAQVWYDTTISFDQGLEYLAKQRQATEDLTLNLDQMRPEVSKGRFCLTAQDGRIFTPTEHALNQVCQWSGVGQWYARKLASGDSKDAETLVHCLNNGFRHIDPKKLFIWRTRVDGTLRAMMTDKYHIIDNEWVLESLKAIVPGGRLSHWYNRCDGVDTIYGNVLIPDSIRAEEDSEYGGGITVSNSEIGERVFSSQPWLYRAICQNGCIWDKTAGIKYKRVHRGKPKAVDYKVEFDNLRKNIELQIPLVSKNIDAMLMTKLLNWKGDSIKPLFAELSSVLGLVSGMPQRLLEAYNVEPHASAFGLINAATRASQSIKHMDTVLKLEQWAGDFIGNNGLAWNSLVSKANAWTAKEVDAVFAA